MTLTFRERELVNIGASVATGCKPCTDYHFGKAREAGADDDEIRRAIADALVVRDSARAIMERHGLQHLGLAQPPVAVAQPERPSRQQTLVAVAAAFAVNCTTNLRAQLAAARAVGIAEDELQAVLNAATFIKGEAAHYVGEIVQLQEENVELRELLDQLKQTQARLVQAEKMAALGKLVAGVVHELNTPLGALNSATDLVGRALGELAAAPRAHAADVLQALRTSTEIAQRASARISTIVGSLKAFVRLDGAGFQRADLHRGLESTLTLLEHRLGQAITVERRFGELPAIACYPEALNQVFMHLLSNAIDAIEGAGRITISTAATAEEVRIAIADTGVGIAEEQLPGLFDPDISKKGTRIKAGFGLFTCYQIVRQHEGEISVASRPGEGSTFTVVLPTDLERRPGARVAAQAPDGAAAAAHRCARRDPAQH